MNEKNKVGEDVTKREWRPPWFLQQLIRLSPWGFPRQVLLILEEGEKTIPEISDGFNRFMKHFGHFGREEVVAGYTEETFNLELLKAIENLKNENLVKQKGENFSLTDAGLKKAKKHQKEYLRMGRRIENLLHPQTVSLVCLGVHIVLAVIKLTAGFTFGSIGLISDGIDTAVDGFSSILVYIGLRLKKELVVNIILVVLMLGVGIITATESIRRIILPQEVEADFLTFAAALCSGLVCLLLSLYQRYVAIRSRQQSLITQAVDSRNHAIVASGVIIGLIAALLHFPLLDTIVGLVVAGLILKSGIELALDLIRTLRGEEMDFYHYELGFVEAYRSFQHNQLSDWLLFIVSKDQFESQTQLLNYCRNELNVQDVPILRELGYRKGSKIDKQVKNVIEILVSKGLITTDGGIRITRAGLDAMSNGIHP